MLLDVQHLKKVYQTRDVKTLALKDIHFEVQEQEFVAIMGESGSGKSTLLNILATFDQPSEGRVILNGIDLAAVKSNQLAKFRRDHLGFVFQDSSVLDSLTNKDNILLPLVLSGVSKDEMKKRLFHYSAFLEIDEILSKYPYEISGGQKQRVAIARALINQPDILLADEPTGALDSKTSAQIMDLFQQINAEGHTILMVTHSVKAAAASNRVLFIRDGIIFNELYRGELDDHAFQEKISDALTLISKRGV